MTNEETLKENVHNISQKVAKVAIESGIEVGWRARDHDHSLEDTLEKFRELWDREPKEK